MKYSVSYLICLQFLGFRFSGWQKQKNAKTLHDVVDKTLLFVLKNTDFKTIGVGRTDAKVSANVYYVQLFTDDILEANTFIRLLNVNFPADFRAISMQKVPISFNIINADKIKEYHYYFSFGDKNHPFAASFVVNVDEVLNIALMKKGAKAFEGEHYFNKYCTKPSKNTIFKRVIDSCEIVENDVLTANFFPEHSYILKIRGKGFLRYQVRLIMATLFELGKENISFDFIEKSLQQNNDQKPLRNIAPASGLQLYTIEFKL
ncbi:tRNA pseudouridine(38-40) synthase TruA [Polaribacter sp. R77954]|uniref:tRNA pseudouridine(38-40) synthase TruA n=1 Tax=Polaribacter sp. R77954 TaxID=3093870 RepID=UPI0037C830DB